LNYKDRGGLARVKFRGSSGKNIWAKKNRGSTRSERQAKGKGRTQGELPAGSVNKLEYHVAKDPSTLILFKKFSERIFQSTRKKKKRPKTKSPKQAIKDPGSCKPTKNLKPKCQDRRDLRYVKTLLGTCNMIRSETV